MEKQIIKEMASNNQEQSRTIRSKKKITLALEITRATSSGTMLQIQSAQVLHHLKQNHALYFIDLREKYISE